jgi:hypothetical protein
MADAAPLNFVRKLGGLFPVNEAAERALSAIAYATPVKVKIARTQGNNKRIALYWITLGIAAPMLEEHAPGLNADLLHKVLKDRYGLVKVIALPSGQEVRDYDSISFHSMTEPDRAKYIDFAFKTLSSWLGVSVEELTREAKAA